MVINFKSLHELIMHVTCLCILLWNSIAVKIISFLKFGKHAKILNITLYKSKLQCWNEKDIKGKNLLRVYATNI